jgi:hypothetical protein
MFDDFTMLSVPETIATSGLYSQERGVNIIPHIQNLFDFLYFHFATSLAALRVFLFHDELAGFITI